MFDFQSYLGKKFSAVEKELRARWAKLRVIRPTEFEIPGRDLTRLKVYLDKDGIITNIYNG